MNTRQLIAGFLFGATGMVGGPGAMAQGIDPAAEIRAQAEPVPEKEASKKTAFHASRFPTAAAYKAGLPSAAPATPAAQHRVAITTRAGGQDAIAYKTGRAAWATEKRTVPIALPTIATHAPYAPTKPWLPR